MTPEQAAIRAADHRANAAVYKTAARRALKRGDLRTAVALWRNAAHANYAARTLDKQVTP